MMGADKSVNDLTRLVSEGVKYIEISDEYDLKSKKISLPANCVLSFRGGQIKNGTIIGNKTIIEAGMYQIFDNVTLKSKTSSLQDAWISNTPFPEWFGASTDSMIDSRLAIQQCLDVFNKVKLNGKYYLLSADGDGNGLKLPDSSSIVGDNMQVNQFPSFDTNDNSIVADSKGIKIILNIGSRCIVRNLAIIGNNASFDLVNKITALYSYETSRVTIENVDITYCYTALDMASYMSSFSKVMCHHVVEGFYLHGLDNSPETTLSITNCFVYDFRYVGFKIISIYGAVFDACGCDSDNKQYVLKDGRNYIGAFYLDNSIALTFRGCGTEDVCKALTINFCINCDINIFRLGTYNKDYDALYSNDVNVIDCRECTLTYYGRVLNCPKEFKHINYKLSEKTRNRFYKINSSEVKFQKTLFGLSADEAMQTIQFE